MRVIVVGAGEVGFDVARILAQEQHDVAVVDADPEALGRAADRLDVMTVTGSGTAATTLVDAGVEEADMLVAVTSIDEVNVIACMMADRLGVETTIARVRSDELTQHESVLSTHDFGIDVVIHPEESAAAEVTRLIRRASATDVLTFANERLQLVGMRIGEGYPVIGKTLREVATENSEIDFRIMAVVRGARTLLPRGDEKIHENDQIFVLGGPESVSRVAEAMGKSEVQMQNIMVLGGSKVGARVVEQLCDSDDRRVKLVEPDRERAQELSEVLPGALVLCGDATDVDLLASEGLSEMDAFVAVTDDEESNLVTCLMAKHLGVQKTVGLLSKPAYIPISQTIGLDAAVSTKLAVSREVTRFLRGKNVRSVATVHGLDAEILEIEAADDAKVVGKPLKDLSFPKGVLVGAVQQTDHAEVATGTTQINAGDRAIVFVLPGKEEDAEALFK
jgi:trk system potassium uptake protein TrkA